MLKLAALWSVCALTLASCSVSTSSSDTKPPTTSEPDAAGKPVEGADVAPDGAGESPDAAGEGGGDDAGGDGGDDGGKTGTAIGEIKNPGATKCSDGEHSVGDRWKDDCNDCWCKDDGKVVCTRKACKGAE